MEGGAGGRGAGRQRLGGGRGVPGSDIAFRPGPWFEVTAEACEHKQM